MRVLIAMLAAAWVMPAHAARPAIGMVVACQQNLSDGRILVTDGTLLPPDARYVVKRYTPSTKDAGWSHGQCVLSVTKGVSG
jgi:hypothetical protein